MAHETLLLLPAATVPAGSFTPFTVHPGALGPRSFLKSAVPGGDLLLFPVPSALVMSRHAAMAGQ